MKFQRNCTLYSVFFLLVEIRHLFHVLFIYIFICNCLYPSWKMMSLRVALFFVCASHSFLFVLCRRWPRYWIIRESTLSCMCLCSRPQIVSWWTWKGNTVSATSKKWWTSSKRGETGRAVVCFSLLNWLSSSLVHQIIPPRKIHFLSRL